MSATDRQSSERVFHDQQARQRAVTFVRRPQDLYFEDDSYLDHETWIRPAACAVAFTLAGASGASAIVSE